MKYSNKKYVHNFANPFLNKIYSRLHNHNQNFLAIICGQTGSGKSWSAIKLAELLDPTFNIDRIIFSSNEFYKLINSKLPRGAFIIWDEAGLNAASREWYRKEQIQMNKILQTFRHLNLGVIFTIPNLKFIDSQPRELVHALIETKQKPSNDCTYLSFKYLDANQQSGKVYYKRDRHRNYIVGRIILHKANTELLKEYEKKANALKKQVAIDKEIELHKSKEIKKSRQQKTFEEIVKENKVDEILNMTIAGLGAKYDLSFPAASITKKMVKQYKEKQQL